MSIDRLKGRILKGSFNFWIRSLSGAVDKNPKAHSGGNSSNFVGKLMNPFRGFKIRNHAVILSPREFTANGR
jgi:hypothetical protein